MARTLLCVSTHMNGVTLSVSDDVKGNAPNAASDLVSYANADIMPGNFTYVGIALSTDDVFVWGSCDLDGDSRKKTDTDVRFKDITPTDKTVPVQSDSTHSHTIH